MPKFQFVRANTRGKLILAKNSPKLAKKGVKKPKIFFVVRAKTRGKLWGVPGGPLTYMKKHSIIATEFNQLWLIYVTGVLGGFNIGGIFAVDRVFMTRLSPEEHLGEFYGLYSTVGRFATIIGPILWGLIVNSLELGRNVAMGSLIVLLAISFYIIRGVSDKAEI